MYYFEEWQFALCLSILSALNSCYCFLNQPSTFCTVLILDSSLTSHFLSCPRSFSQTRVQEGLQVWVTSSVRIVVCFNKCCWSFLISLHGDKILIQNRSVSNFEMQRVILVHKPSILENFTLSSVNSNLPHHLSELQTYCKVDEAMMD